jgi:hypothetical protein
MTKLALLSTALIAVSMLATPAIARKSHRLLAEGANVSALPGMGYIGGRPCRLAPRVGAFATAPWENGPPCEPVSGF